MKVTVLGTGTSQGVPVIACTCDVCHSDNPKDNRLRSSVLIEKNGKTIVIDTGPDFRAQFLRENITNLHAVLLTHLHKDHVAGLDDIRAFNYKYKKAMEVFADRRTLDHLVLEFPYIFREDKYPGVPEVETFEISEQPFIAAGIEIIPVLAYHYMLPVFGFRIDNFAYLTDVKTLPEPSIEKLMGLDILILNALRKQPHISHLNLEEALQLVQLLRPKKCYFTHISHLLGKHDIIQSELPEGVFLAYDGLKLEC